jgi:hypothetical protein
MTTRTTAQLDREIAEIAGTTPRPRTAGPSQHPRPLYGHTSEGTAYLVADYPYGFRERTQIRYWLEHKEKKGWRFVSQTMNPKTGRWNKAKASTYADWAGAMYLDDDGHVQWQGIGVYSDARKILAFVRAFPGADLSVLRSLAPARIRQLRRMISGEIFVAINGVRQSYSEADASRDRAELALWEEIGALLSG